jgi:hypothetical protein
MYREQRLPDEGLALFFRRVGPAAVTAALQDLAQFAPQEISADDYIDLGETQAFTPEVMDGECAS